MKKFNLFLLCSFLYIIPLIAQKSKEPVIIPSLPLDSTTALYTYSNVVMVTGVTKAELYKRAMDWANIFYNNPNDVIREKNAEEGKLLIKARFKISNEADKKGVVTQAGDVMYALTLNFKDGKYKYEITKINWQQISYYPIERWNDTSAATFKPAFAYYLKQTDENIKKIVADFQKKIAESAKAKTSDW